VATLGRVLVGDSPDPVFHQAVYVDHSSDVLEDEVLARLLTSPKVIVTPHMGFMTWEALDEIMTTTLNNLTEFERGAPLTHELLA